MKQETKQIIKESIKKNWLIRLIKFIIGGKKNAREKKIE